MRLVATLSCASLALLACTAPDDRPYYGGDSTDDNSPAYDASPGEIDASDAAVPNTTSRVCISSDLRNPSSCSSIAGGLTVSLRQGNTVLAITNTASDGSFTLPSTIGANLRAVVSGATVTTTAVAYSATVPTVIVAPSASYWLTLQAASGLLLPDGTGSLAVYLRRDGLPAAGVAVTPTPAATNITIYDGTSATSWAGGATGDAGVAIVAGIVEGPVSLLTTSDVSALSIGGLSAWDGELQILTAVLPSP